MVRWRKKEFYGVGTETLRNGKGGICGGTQNDRTAAMRVNISRTDGKRRDTPKALDSGSGLWAQKEPSIQDHTICLEIREDSGEAVKLTPQRLVYCTT
jgi:hypothetical protein